MGYSISEVAEMVGMRPSTIRYYEKRGLLPDMTAPKAVYVLSANRMSLSSSLSAA